MSYQKCPICNGTGISPSFLSTSACPTCLGTRIISEINGLPPASTPATSSSSAINKMNPFVGDFRDANMESQDEYFGKK